MRWRDLDHTMKSLDIEPDRPVRRSTYKPISKELLELRKQVLGKKLARP